MFQEVGDKNVKEPSKLLLPLKLFSNLLQNLGKIVFISKQNQK